MNKQLQSCTEIEEKHPRTHVPIECDESNVYSPIRGGVIDAFDREGHKEVERRYAVIHNNHPTSKERVMLLGDANGVDLFLHNVFGADVFLDTAIRWLDGDENKSGDVKILSENIFNLISAGARSVWCAHHAIKFDDASSMTLNNMFRGSGEYGAALSNAYGLLQEDKALNKVRFHPIVSRDLDELIPDMILQGRPHLSETGNFKVIDAMAEPRKAGSPGDAKKQQKIEFARTVSGSLQEKADAVFEKFGTRHSKSTIHEWLKDFDSDQGE